MKKYRVEGSDVEDLIRRVAEKLNTTPGNIGYNILAEDKGQGKVILEVWVEEKKVQAVGETPEEMIKIKLSKEGVFLKINKGNLDLNDVINFIAEKDIQDPDIEQINTAYTVRDIEVKIADFYEGFYKEAEVDVEIAQDLMEAYIYITEPKGMNLPSFEDIKKKIEDAGIVYGFKEELLREALNSKSFNQRFLIAKGDQPAHGKDGVIRYDIKSSEKKDKLRPQISEDGRVDFKNLDLIENVLAGQVLAEKIPPEKGVPGKNIKGQSIEAKDGKDTVFPAGKNTEVNPDGTQLISKINGMVVFKDKKINVVDVFVTNTVGIATGNISFIGSVLVKGDVMYDYKVEADGNIEVKGNLEKSEIKATGDVVIRGNIFGKMLGRIDAKGDVILNFAESVLVEADGNVIVNEGIMNSKVYSGKKISVIDKKGVIVGGEVIAAEGVEAINIGSHLAIRTDIEVGSNPKLIEESKHIENELLEINKKMDQIEKNLTLLQKLKASLKENMPKDKEEMMMQLLKAKFSITKHTNELKTKHEEITKLLSDVKRATVDVFGTCYPGVKIKIRKGSYFVKEEIKNARFYYDESSADVRFTALK